MKYFDEAKELLAHSENSLKAIENDYKKSLNDKNVNSTLLISIKNLMENLRSALDFVAHGLYEKYGNSSTNPKIYFPYASSGVDKAGYHNKKIIDKIPGLKNNRPDIAGVIESYQHFSSINNSWLPIFMDLNNENKHQRLTPQVRKETKQLNISSGGVSISMGEGVSISMGQGAFIQIGNATIMGGQTINVNNPANITGHAKQEIITWVSFHFSANDVPVMELLQKSVTGVTKIVNELSVM
ncbi:MAG TPA: hypothetical protein VGD89_03385 [Flavipsychrobacter sp.]